MKTKKPDAADKIIAEQQAMIEALRQQVADLNAAMKKIACVLDDPRWDGTREDGPRAMLDWCITVALNASFIACAPTYKGSGPNNTPIAGGA